MAVLPGLILALIIALGAQYLSKLIGIDLMGLPKSPISAIMMAILLGMVIRNTMTLPEFLRPGIRFGLEKVLRLGIKPLVAADQNVGVADDDGERISNFMGNPSGQLANHGQPFGAHELFLGTFELGVRLGQSLQLFSHAVSIRVEAIGNPSDRSTELYEIIAGPSAALQVLKSSDPGVGPGVAKKCRHTTNWVKCGSPHQPQSQQHNHRRGDNQHEQRIAVPSQRCVDDRLEWQRSDDADDIPR